MNYKCSMFNYFFAYKGNEYVYNAMMGAKSICALDMKTDIADKLKNGSLDGVDKNSMEALQKKGVVVPASIDEKARRNVFYAKTINDDTLSLVIHTTRRCNFRCTYCCLDFVNDDLSVDVQESIVRFIKLNIPKYRVVEINWFGGEPLLNISAIQNLSARIQKICSLAGKVYNSSITTNGFLLNETNAKVLVEAGVNTYFVTLDGLPKYHDKARVLINGGPTFETILSNLKKMKKIQSKKMRVNVRVNFTSEMMQDCDSIYEYLSKEFQDDSRFRLFCRTVVDAGGERIHQLKEQNQILEGNQIKELEERLAEYSGGMEYSANFRSLEPGGFTCPAVKCGKYTIDVYGGVYKCDVIIDETMVGKLDCHGKILYGERCEEAWEGIIFQNSERCDNCALSPICFKGACPMQEVVNQEKTCIIDEESNQLDGILSLYVSFHEVEVI